ncbi:MAG: hypothetical protein ACYC96_15690 [Fimbriimonadaceae bacterium]
MRLRALFVPLGLLLGASGQADDGILYYYGAPKLMRGECAIRMVSEVVTAKVYRDHTTVRCRFVFRNGGAPVEARIGFPDGSDQVEDGGLPAPHLANFRSNVDGKRVPTTLQRSPVAGDAPLYHVKTVHFGALQTRVVEDSYSAALSGGGTSTIIRWRGKQPDNLYMSQFTYVMASGGSWKGNISHATVRVTFMEENLRHLVALPESQVGPPEDCKTLNRLPRNGVIWAGFARPKVVGNRMTFDRRNFKPTANDDIRLTFDWRRFADSIWSKGD